MPFATWCWRRREWEEKEEEEVGDRGAPVDRVTPCTPKWRLREGKSPTFKRGAGGWRRAFHNYGFKGKKVNDSPIILYKYPSYYLFLHKSLFSLISLTTIF